jgi:hypothetical protein
MTVSNLLVQPGNKFDNAIKLVTSSQQLAPNVLQQLGTSSAMRTFRQLVNRFVTTSRVFSRVCKLSQIRKQVVTRLLSSPYQDVRMFIRMFWMTITDLLQVIPTRLTQAVATSLIVAINLLTTCYCTCRLYQTCWNDLLRICWPHQPACYKVITTCFRLANNYEHTVRIHRVGRL